jgi:2',3'-cyclic-nucleotide 2'-phosphodiesterase (5'-nucleotidase family)
VLKPLRLAAFLALALVHVSCLPTLAGENVDLSGQQVRLTFLQTADIHSRLLPYDFSPLKTDVDLGLIPEAGPFGGATRMASIIKRERANSSRVLHLDSGDAFQGAPVFNLNLGEVEYKFLTLMNVDAAVIGNHEFDAGAANFTKQARDNARFPVLAANYFWEDYNQALSNQTSLYTAPYTLKNVGGIRVGIIGMANLSSLNSIIERGNSMQVIPLEQNEILRTYVDFLRPAVDLVVVVSHGGLTEDQELVAGYEAYYEWGLAKAYVNRPSLPWTVREWYGPKDVDSSVVRVWVPGVEGVDAIFGGHLHIVLNPPQELTDPAGRKVLLSHGGSFAKYVIRLDAMVQMPKSPNTAEGAEIVSHDFKVFPIDSLWCSDALHAYYKSQFWNPGDFPKDPKVKQGLADCSAAEDLDTTQLLLPYITDLDVKLNLTSLFSYAPQNIERRNNSTGGDSPLGNIAADSMRRRQGVEAEVGLTNSLGIRDNLYAGPLTQEAMFNVFPFENTINVMYLSGREMQEMFDFVTQRSSERGCVSQAQVSGARFTMDCAQAQLNNLLLSCDPKKNGADCPTNDRTGSRKPWQCLQDATTGDLGRCWSNPGEDISINGKALDPNETYRIAVNDYIARGGSGFLVLKRNTTRVETGIPLRDSLIGFMQNFCTCDDLLAAKKDTLGNLLGKNGQACGNRDPEKLDHWIVDDLVVQYCKTAKTFHDELLVDRGGCTCADVFKGNVSGCTTGASQEDWVRTCVGDVSAGPALGRCACRDALAGAPECGTVTRATKNFCMNPTGVPVAIGQEDGRIARRVK